MFKLTKNEFVTIFFIIASLLAAVYFPAVGNLQQITATVIFFAIMPLLFNKFFLKKDIKELGFGVGDYKQGLKFGIISLFFVSVIIFIMSYFFGFLVEYSVPEFVVDNFGMFVSYEIALIFIVMIYEFYFRGFLMPVFSKKVGYWSILIQSCVFFVLVFLDKEIDVVQVAPYLVVAPFAGLIAYKSRSILYSGAFQFIVVLVLNVIIIKRVG